MKNFLNSILFILAILGIISIYIIGINNDKKEEHIKKLNTSCLEDVLDSYLTKDDINPYEISLRNIIDSDLSKVNYSKVVVNELKDIYVIIKTSDDEVINGLDKYFENSHKGYIKKELEEFLIYLDNKNNLLEIDENISKCLK